MPFSAIDELPVALQVSLPEEAQEIYCTAYNQAWDQYEDPNKRHGNGSREMAAHRKAWEAVQREFEQDVHGRWVRIYTRV